MKFKLHEVYITIENRFVSVSYTHLIRINAEDSTSFRASVNSAIKWIKLSLEINNLTI